MIIERFKDNDILPIYQHLRDKRRGIPDERKYLDSWIEPNFAHCFQLMERGDARLLQQRVLSWRGHGATFEIIPVVPSEVIRDVVTAPRTTARCWRLAARYWITLLPNRFG